MRIQPLQISLYNTSIRFILEYIHQYRHDIKQNQRRLIVKRFEGFIRLGSGGEDLIKYTKVFFSEFLRPNTVNTLG